MIPCFLQMLVSQMADGVHSCTPQSLCHHVAVCQAGTTETAFEASSKCYTITWLCPTQPEELLGAMDAGCAMA